MSNIENKYADSYKRSIDLMKSILSGDRSGNLGFFASPVEKDNYKRLFTRDAFWIMIASILSGDEDLLKGCTDSLKKLAQYQRNDGAIPSNISLEGKASYGIINQRIDPTTLFVIGCITFDKYYPEKGLIDSYLDKVKMAIMYLESAWENKKYDLLYIPRAGNWADEYIQQGFVLYDEVLWYLAIREYASLLLSKGDTSSGIYESKARRIKEMINSKFWIKNIEQSKQEQIYERLKNKFDFDNESFYIHFYYAPDRRGGAFDHPCGIFDAFGNVLALLAGIPTEDMARNIINFIDSISSNKYPLIPAHYPFFPEETFRSKKLHQYRFKQFVGHYHNGGLWSWYTGPYVAALMSIDRTPEAEKFLTGILNANRERKDNMDFYEYHTGKRAIVYLDVTYEKGMDFFLSTLIAKEVKRSKSMVLFHFNGKKVDAESDISLRELNVGPCDTVRVSAVGPDSGEVLEKICGIAQCGDQVCFSCHDMKLKGSKAGGMPLLGVSAAAYIIAYKAFFEDKIIFAQR